MRVWRRRVAYSQLKPKRQEVPAKTLSVCPDDPSLPVVKFCLLFLRPKWGWHLNKIISVTPSDFRPLSHPFVRYAPWTGGSFLSLALGQLPRLLRRSVSKYFSGAGKVFLHTSPAPKCLYSLIWRRRSRRSQISIYIHRY